MSGGLSGQDRPGLARIFQRIEAGECNGIVVAKLDRFSRSLAGAIRDLEWLDSQDADFASVGDQIDTTTPNGRFLFHVTLALAELERGQRAESWGRARRDAVEERGWHLSSEGVVGYVFGSQPLEPHPEWGPLVTMSFERLAQGTSTFSDIARLWTDRGMPRGRRQLVDRWEPFMVRRTIARRVYLGEARHGDYVNPAAHPPLTDHATFQLANVNRTADGPRKAGTQDMLLNGTGLLVCASCCNLLRGGTVKGRGQNTTLVYRCRGRRNGDQCPGPQVTIAADIIEPWLQDQAHLALGAQPGETFEELAAANDAAAERFSADSDAIRELLAMIGTTGIDRVYLEEEISRRQRSMAAAEETLGINMNKIFSLEGDRSGAVMGRDDLTLAFDAVIVRPGGRGGTVPVEDRCLIIPKGQRPSIVATHYRPTPRRPFPWDEWIGEHGDGQHS